jgi:hypothetical protein
MAKKKRGWLEIDRKGLRMVIAHRPKSFVLYELIQNALDEHGVTTVTVEMNPCGRNRQSIRVSDDSPDGYQDIRHAWTMYAPSKKKPDPTRRGVFNVGCKMVLALCESATVISTKSAVSFDETEGRKLIRARTDKGTVFTGTFKMSLTDAERAIAGARTIIPPEGVKLVVNGQLVRRPECLGKLKATLSTVISDDEGSLRPTLRCTEVGVYASQAPKLHEMGIPVVEFRDGLPWSIDVGQRVPLNVDRDNVTPGYLRKLRVVVLNQMHGSITTKEEATKPWVVDATSSPDCSAEALEAVLKARYGEKRVAYDPSDPEGSKLAVSKGYTVVHGGSLTAGQWQNVKKFTGTLSPAGQVTPSPVVLTGPDGVKAVPHADWKQSWMEIAGYAARLWDEIGESNRRLTVQWYSSVSLMHSATWNRRDTEITFNAARFGSGIRAWERGDREEAVALMIHEFAHDVSGDHLSAEYHRAICRLGARCLEVTLDREAVR